MRHLRFLGFVVVTCAIPGLIGCARQTAPVGADREDVEAKIRKMTSQKSKSGKDERPVKK
jgi:hypothetical protein